MFNLLTWFAIGGAIVARTSAAVCYKIAAQQKNYKRVVAFFLLGLSFGFFNPVCVMVAMKGNHPNLIIASIGGIGSVFFVLVINRAFKEELTPRQWLAIAVIFSGTILLQFGSKDEPQTGDGALQRSHLRYESTADPIDYPGDARMSQASQNPSLNRPSGTL